MAENWLADVRKYVPDADERVVSALVRYLGIALQKRDSSLVAFTDKRETDHVRETFLKNKLGLMLGDSTLDAAIAGVGERMKDDRTRNRVTVYYLLAQHFGLLTLFGGASATDGVAGTEAPVTFGGSTAGAGNYNDAISSVPLAAAGLGGASASADTPGMAEAKPAAPPPSIGAPQIVDPSNERERSGGMGWLAWLLLAAALAALLFFGLRSCSNQNAEVPSAMNETAVSETAGRAEGMAGPATATSVPDGAGVVTADREGKPMLKVYFDTGKSDVSNDLATAASAVKAYLGSNSDAVLAVSGYNDPTGNAAANAELSKKRAQSVKAALEKLGFAPDRVVLEKPAEATTTGTDNSAARRVEVTVKG